MLEFREIDYAKDVPEIVDLLRISLSKINTEEHFIWKHFKNPFGKSYGLLACDKEKIVGIRMFMFWNFRKDENIIKAIRPVDTFTHPEYRGKGIFKKLTLSGLDYCKEKYDIVFNTPNNKSLPRYLKMGWHENPTQSSYCLGLVFPTGTSKEIRLKKISSDDIGFSNLELDFTYWRTNITEEFIRWRYAASIYEKVFFNFNGSSGYVIYRIQKIKGFKVLILVDYIGKRSYADKVIKALAYKNNIILVYYLNNGSISIDPIIFMKRYKSVVVYRDDPSLIISRVIFSIGDLEGRL